MEGVYSVIKEEFHSEKNRRICFQLRFKTISGFSSKMYWKCISYCLTLKNTDLKKIRDSYYSREYRCRMLFSPVILNLNLLSCPQKWVLSKAQPSWIEGTHQLIFIYPLASPLPLFWNNQIRHLLKVLQNLGLRWWLRGKESACNAGDAGDAGSIPGSGRSSRGGNGNSLRDSFLEKIPWAEEFMVLQRVGHDWVTKHTPIANSS